MVTSVAPGPGEAGERSEGVEIGSGRRQTVFDVAEVVASVGGGLAGVVEFSGAIEGPLVEDGVVGVDDVPESAVGGPRVVDGGQRGVGDPGEGGGDVLVAGALVGEAAAVITIVHERGVPGVGGVAGAGLAGVAAVGVQSGGAQQVDVVPSAAFGAVDGARPCVRQVRCRVGPDTLHELARDGHAGTGVGANLQAARVDSGDGGCGAVDEG